MAVVLDRQPQPPAPAPTAGPERCVFDGTVARYLVVARSDGSGPADGIPVCLRCWLERAGTIPGLVGARRLR